MIQKKYLKTFYTGSYFVLALLTGLIMSSIMNRTEPNADGAQVLIITWLFPVAFFLFSTISLCIASNAPRFLKTCRLNQWNAVWVIPFLLLGVSWQFFGSWTLVFSIFYWIYIITHTASLLLSRQTYKKPVPLGIEDWLLLFIGLSALNIWFLPSISLTSLISVLAHSLCVSLITIACALLATTHSKTVFSGTVWQRSFLILISLTVPAFMAFTKISSIDILVLAISSWLLFSDSTSKNVLLVSHVLASFILIGAPLILPEGIFISLWICILCVLKNRRNKEFEGILIPGSAILFFLIGFFVAVIRMKGQVLAGNIVYSLPKSADWFSSLFDRSNGLVPVAPWVLIAFSGWLLVIPKRKAVDWVRWLGFPFILIAFTVFEWICHGKPPGWNHWLLMLPVIFPYYGGIWSNAIKPITGAVVRVLTLYSLFQSAILYVYMRFSGLDIVNLTEALADFSKRIGIELSQLVPVFNHSLPGYSKIHWIWIGSTAVFTLLLACFVRIPYKSSQDNKPGILDTVLIAGMVGLAGLCFQAGQIWHVIPLEKDIHIAPDETFTIDTNFDGKVYAIKIISDLSHSTHLPQGYTIAELVLETLEGDTHKQELQAGIHSAEWAYNRPDVRRDIQHRRPEAAWSWIVEETNGQKFSGMTYKGMIYLQEPLRISTLSIQNLEKNSRHTVTIRGLALMVQSDQNKWSEARQLVEAPLLLSEDANSHTYRLSGDASYRQIILDSTLANASIVPTGAPIGSITIKNKDKSVQSWIVKAGIDTAEWSAERPDIIGKLRHDIPAIAYSERRIHHSTDYLAHVYRSQQKFDTLFFPIEISITYFPGENELPNGEWVVHGLVLR